MDMFSLNDTGTDNEGNNIKNAIKMIFSLEPPVTLSEHIIEKDGIGKVVQTGEKVLLGKMSFQMVADELDMSSFKLVENENASPQTGIKINCDGLHYYYQQSTFRFADNRVVGSNDANLTNIIVSSGEKDENNPESSTYKEYEMSPKFNPETKRYEVELLENIDSLDIKAIKSDEKATMKIKVPKRDEEGNLAYEADGTTIVYEEKEMTSDVPIGVILNKLGEPDTLVSIIVTAEDGSLTNIYEVNIHRPYGCIKGKIYTEPTSFTTEKYIAEVLAYTDEKLAGIVNWDDIINNPKVSDDLHIVLRGDGTVAQQGIEESNKLTTNDDGTFEMYVPPAKYHLLIDKKGYLDQYYINVEVTEGNTIDLCEEEINKCIDLIPGDINKDGSVGILDKTIMTKQNGKTNTEHSDFNASADLNDDEKINITDKTILTKNNNLKRKIINLKGGKQ